MEYLMMFISHLLKSAEYYIVEGIPIVPLEHLPEAINGIVFNFVKIATIYFSMLG